jgi:hypothetical protein
MHLSIRLNLPYLLAVAALADCPLSNEAHSLGVL